MDHQLINQRSHENAFYMVDIESCLNLPHHVYLKDKRGRYVECNTKQANSFGLSTGTDVIGKTDKDFDFINPDQTQTVVKNDNEVIIQEKSKLAVEVFTFVDRKPVTMFSLKIPFRNKSGNIIGVFGVSAFLSDANIIVPERQIVSGEQEENNLLVHEKRISRRERECLNYLVQGMTAKQISRVLQLSPRTVEFYIENLKKKFNCSNRVELIAKAYSA